MTKAEEAIQAFLTANDTTTASIVPIAFGMGATRKKKRSRMVYTFPDSSTLTTEGRGAGYRLGPGDAMEDQTWQGNSIKEWRRLRILEEW